jgi:hypothetical protein
MTYLAKFTSCVGQFQQTNNWSDQKSVVRGIDVTCDAALHCFDGLNEPEADKSSRLDLKPRRLGGLSWQERHARG